MARQKNLDLLLVSEEANPPVCRLIDFGEFKYQQHKKEKQAKKVVKGQVLKELKMSPKISAHDYQVRVDRGREFLKKGFRVKLCIPFRGREIVHPELGRALVQKYLESVTDLIAPGQADVQSAHRSLVVILNPK